MRRSSQGSRASLGQRRLLSTRTRAVAETERPSARAPKSKRDIELLPGGSLESTPEQKQVVYAAKAALIGATIVGAARCDNALESVEAIVAFAAAYLLSGAEFWSLDGLDSLDTVTFPESRADTTAPRRASSQPCKDRLALVILKIFITVIFSCADLGTGIYHWFVDNYGDGDTPVFGRQIEAFQGHHRRPWTITEREFANNVYLVRFSPLIPLDTPLLPRPPLRLPPGRPAPDVSIPSRGPSPPPMMVQIFKPVFPIAVALGAASPFLPPAADVFLGAFGWLVCMSQQFHAWSHMKRSALPAPVLWAQENGLLISRKMHGAHHLAPFEGNYCIVSGFWNPILDQDGSDRGFFRR